MKAQAKQIAWAEGRYGLWRGTINGSCRVATIEWKQSKEPIEQEGYAVSLNYGEQKLGYDPIVALARTLPEAKERAQKLLQYFVEILTEDTI